MDGGVEGERGRVSGGAPCMAMREPSLPQTHHRGLGGTMCRARLGLRLGFWFCPPSSVPHRAMPPEARATQRCSLQYACDRSHGAGMAQS